MYLNGRKEKNWNYVNSGDIDLSAYEGKKITIAFRYKSTTECAPTVEFKNMSLTSTVSGYYEGVDIYKEIPESEAEMPARAVTRASDVKPNASALYQYDGSVGLLRRKRKYRYPCDATCRLCFYRFGLFERC